MSALDLVEREFNSNELEALKRVIDPKRGAVVPPDLVNFPASIQTVSGWLQAPAIPPNSTEVSPKPNAVIWQTLNGCVALNRYSLFRNGYTQKLVAQTLVEETASPAWFTNYGDLWWNMLGNIVVSPTDANGNYTTDDLYIPVEDNRNVKLSPDIAETFYRGRLVGGRITVVSDSTSTTSAALSGTFNAGYIGDTRGIPGLSPPKLTQNTVTRKDTLMNVKVQEGIYMSLGPDVSDEMGPIDRILTDITDEGAYESVWTGELSSVVQLGTDAFTVTPETFVATQTYYGQSQWVSAINGTYYQRNGGALEYTQINQAIEDWALGTSAIKSCMTESSLFFSSLFKTQGNSVCPKPIQAVPLPAIGLLDEPNFVFSVTKKGVDATVINQLRVTAYGANEGYIDTNTAGPVASHLDVQNMLQGIVGSLQITHLWAYEYLDPEDGKLKINLITSDGGTEIVAVSYTENELLTANSAGGIQKGDNAVTLKIRSDARRPTVHGIAVLPRTATSATSSPQYTVERNLIYAGTVVSVVSTSRGCKIADHAGAHYQEGTTWPDMIPDDAAPMQVVLNQVKFFSPGMYKPGALSASCVEWRSVAAGQTVNLTAELYVQAQATSTVAPYIKTQIGNTNAIISTNARFFDMLALLYNSDEVKQIRRIWKLTEVEENVRDYAESLTWEKFIDDCVLILKGPTKAAVYGYMQAGGLFDFLKKAAKTIGSGLKKGVEFAEKAAPYVQKAIEYAPRVAEVMGADGGGMMGAAGEFESYRPKRVRQRVQTDSDEEEEFDSRQRMRARGGMMGALGDGMMGAAGGFDNDNDDDEDVMDADAMFRILYPEGTADTDHKDFRIAVGNIFKFFMYGHEIRNLVKTAVMNGSSQILLDTLTSAGGYIVQLQEKARKPKPGEKQTYRKRYIIWLPGGLDRTIPFFGVPLHSHRSSQLANFAEQVKNLQNGIAHATTIVAGLAANKNIPATNITKMQDTLQLLNEYTDAVDDYLQKQGTALEPISIMRFAAKYYPKAISRLEHSAQYQNPSPEMMLSHVNRQNALTKWIKNPQPPRLYRPAPEDYDELEEEAYNENQKKVWAKRLSKEKVARTPWVSSGVPKLDHMTFKKQAPQAYQAFSKQAPAETN